MRNMPSRDLPEIEEYSPEDVHLVVRCRSGIARFGKDDCISIQFHTTQKQIFTFLIPRSAAPLVLKDLQEIMAMPSVPLNDKGEVSIQ